MCSGGGRHGGEQNHSTNPRASLIIFISKRTRPEGQVFDLGTEIGRRAQCEKREMKQQTKVGRCRPKSYQAAKLF
jgi:hypothetical protein